MDVSRVLAMMMALAGNRNREERGFYAEAIVAVTDDAEERAALVTIARTENWFHLRSYPPFGVTDFVYSHRPWEVCRFYGDDPRNERGCRPVTVRLGAQLALTYLRFIRRVRCPGRPWADVFGRYHHGVGRDDPEEPFAGCYSDALAARQVGWMSLGLRRRVR